MRSAGSLVTRPILRYFGGKWLLASRIIAYFPKHTTYVEPCGGGAAVLMQKQRAKLEIYNDIEGDVVNFFRVMRDRPNELIRAIKLTPWARDEFYYCTTPYPDDELEHARRFFVSLWMSIRSEKFDASAGFRTTTLGGRSYSEHARNYVNLIDHGHLMAAAMRLRGVQIENKDYAEVIERHDAFDTLVYLDPPYVSDTRVAKKIYDHEWPDDEHIRAAEVMKKMSGYGIVSGYACGLYKSLYEDEGWERVDFVTKANGGAKRVDSIWLSPRVQEYVKTYHQLDMFSDLGGNE